MAAITKLRRPPITEAIVDFRAALSPSFQPERLAEASGALKSTYPQREEMRRFETRLALTPGQPPAAHHTDSGLIGFKFSAIDGKQVAQFRQDGFTLNRLEPYSSWSELKAESTRLWTIYASVAKPSSIQRLALRYINRFRLPTEGVLDDFVTVLPAIYPGAPAQVTGYAMRTTTTDEKSGISANIAQALEGGPGKPDAVLVLDIDVYRPSPLAPHSPDVGAILDSLRSIKNNVFFGSITEQLVAKFQ